MLTGFEALGAASAVLQVISFATDVVVACKNAYDGVTTSQDDLQRYAGQMSEAVGRVHTRCEQINNANSRFASPELQNIAKECKDAADRLEAEVQSVTRMQAQGDILKSIRKTFRASRHRKKLQALQESLSKYQQVIETELTSHLCTQNDAIHFRQEASFSKLETDVRFLINQLARGITDVKDLVKREHAATRSAITQEGARAEAAINSHTDSQVLELRTAAETKRKCEAFLQSLKAPRMNQRYNDVMDSRDASFNQVFATYEDMIDMYEGDSDESSYSTDDYSLENDGNPDDEGDSGDDDDQGDEYSEDDYSSGETDSKDHNSDGEIDSEGFESSEAASDLSYMSDMDDIYDKWFTFKSWLKSDDKFFYIQGKPGSGKSTLVKFILNQDQTRDLIQEWSPGAIIISYFFWKIGSEEQNSIKGLWCSLLYQRLQDQQHLILSAMQHFSNLSLHSEYHDWSIEDLQAVWNYLTGMDPRSICIFIDGLDEIRDKDGFSQLSKSIQSISELPKVKLCISTRPEAQIMRWLRATNAIGILLEDLTRFDMVVFVRKRFLELLISSHLSLEFSNHLRQELVNKAQGVFLWLHLATRSIIEGIENHDSEDMLSTRIDELPGDLEKLYMDMWQRSNAKSNVYQETARRFFRYVLDGSTKTQSIAIGVNWYDFSLPLTFQIACTEDYKTQQHILNRAGTIGITQIQQMCDETKASVHTRCAGLLEARTDMIVEDTSETWRGNQTAVSVVTGEVAFIHRTAHDFLTDTEVGQRILGREPLSDFPQQTRLLKGLVCALILLTSEMDLPCSGHSIVEQIATFARRWGSEGLQLATQMLDAIQPLFDKHLIRCFQYSWRPEPCFFTYLIQHDVFEDYVISHLTTEPSPHVATSIMREGCNLVFRRNLRKRTFDSLIALGDPHEYGVLLTCYNWYGLDRLDHTSFFVVYEINIQFLLLYLLLKQGEGLAENVSKIPGAEDALTRFDSPSIKVRYFMRPCLAGDSVEQDDLPRRTFERVVSGAVSLSSIDIKRLFGVDLKNQCRESSEASEVRTEADVATQFVNELETEEIDIEDMMITLASENLGLGTYEEAGMIPSLDFRRGSEQSYKWSWSLFPLSMRRLEAAAARKEAMEGHE